jgi:hypothetical protein
MPSVSNWVMNEQLTGRMIIVPPEISGCSVGDRVYESVFAWIVQDGFENSV